MIETEINIYKLKWRFFMRKFFLSMMLFLLVGLSVNAAEYTVSRQVVGTGGFVAVSAGDNYRMSGVFGQPMVGKFEQNIDGKVHTMYLGFWAPYSGTTSVDDDFGTTKGICNYPNPVNKVTNFKFNLKESAVVTLNIYNSLGSLVATAVQGEFLTEGDHTVEWNIESVRNNVVSSGFYRYELLVEPVASSASSGFYLLQNTMMISR